MDKVNAWWLYDIYNWFMVSSHNVQEWSVVSNGPWTVVNKGE
jgi:hypothetical protein